VQFLHYTAEDYNLGNVSHYICKASRAASHKPRYSRVNSDPQTLHNEDQTISAFTHKGQNRNTELKLEIIRDE
jgi:hypothetical protein